MIAKDIITENIVRTQNVSASDAESSERRGRHTEYLIEVASDFYYSHDHSWTYSNDSILVHGAQNFATVPEDFHSLGQYGGIFLQATGRPMTYVSPQTMRRLQATLIATDSPDRYSVYGNATVDLTSGTGKGVLELIQVQLASGDLYLDIHYRSVLPAITDSDFDSSAIDALQFIPERYHQWVLMPGMRALALASLGDSKGNPLETDTAYQAAKKAAIAADAKGKEQGFQLPSFFEGEW